LHHSSGGVVVAKASKKWGEGETGAGLACIFLVISARKWVGNWMNQSQ
jgi:hypothetical protein